MKKTLLFVLVLLCQQAFAQVRVHQLLVEGQVNPIGLDIAQPRFSWKLDSGQRNISQTAYEIKVWHGKKEIWHSARTSSDQSAWVKYAGAALESGKKYEWQVRVWDNKGNVSDWSVAASFRMALLAPADWKAQWIEPGFAEEESRPSPLFRKEFAASKKISSAIAYITAHGLYEAHINGQRVGDAYLTPGWTSYNKRLQYQVYDVTQLLQAGKNAIGVTLGSGWYRGNLAWGGNKDIYGKDVALLFQLHIQYSDGRVERIISDGSWKTATGAIRYSEIYHGETIDARMDKPGWLMPGYNDADWSNAKTASHAMNTLVANYNEPIRKQETFKPVSLIITSNGDRILDFGQNLVGWVMVKARGKAGDKIVLHHSEVLDKDGNFYTESLRAAKQENTYILKGEGTEQFEPHFTWQGFRYVKITDYPGEVNFENFTAVALYSDMRPTGTFSSSHPLVNQLQHNIQWGQRGNFLDVPTDCPQRDERLGWTGDAQAFSRTAAFNFGVHGFFAKWLKDLAADQLPNGKVPFVAPNVLGPDAGGSAGWADAATIIPWNMYLVYGDTKILEDQYESMKLWVQFMQDNSTDNLWNKGFHFGDWLFYRPGDDNDGRSAVTDKYLIAQCFFAHSTQLVIQAAAVLGKNDDVNKYSALLTKIKNAFVKEYLTPSGRLVSGTQTAYVLALNFDMLPENLRQSAADRLAENVKSYDKHLTTGFLGTPYLCHVLSRFGYADLAYDLLLQETYPSWLYPVKMGATTIWERWDGIKPDSTFQTPGMNSFNHYAYGAIGDWMYRAVAGIELAPGSTAYKKSQIKPIIGGGFTHASAVFQSVYGELASGWKIGDGQLLFDVTIPANTTATVYIPYNAEGEITENGKPLAASPELKILRTEKMYVVVEAGSGKYSFAAPWKSDAGNPALEEYVGRYKVEGAAFDAIDISIQNGKLAINAVNFGGGVLDPDSKPDAFKSAESSIQFIRDENKKVVKVILNARFLNFEGVKM